MARYIRLTLVQWHSHISVRMEVYGCPGICQSQVRIQWSVSVAELVTVVSCALRPEFQDLDWPVNECNFKGIIRTLLSIPSLHTAGAWNLNWPIRIQQAVKTLLSWHQCKLTGIALESANVFTGDGIRYSRKGIYNSKNNIRLSKVKNTKQIPSRSFQFDAKNGSPASGMATCPWVLECRQIG